MKMRWITMSALIAVCGLAWTSEPACSAEGAEAPSVDRRDLDQPALIQIFVYGLSVYNRPESADDPAEGFYFPPNTGHNLSLSYGMPRGMDRILEPLSVGPLQGTTLVPLQGSSPKQQTALDPSGSGGLPASSSDAWNPRWLLNVEHLDDQATFDPRPGGTWLLPGNFYLETCGLTMGPDMTGTCKVGIPSKSGFTSVGASEIMVLKLPIEKSVDDSLPVLRIVRGGIRQDISVPRMKLGNCDSSSGSGCAILNGTAADGSHTERVFEYVYDVALVHWPSRGGGPSVRSMQSSHANQLRGDFRNVGPGAWDLKSPGCSPGSTSVDRWTCNAGCDSVQPRCWEYFGEYGVFATTSVFGMPFESPDLEQIIVRIKNIFDVAMCPIVEYP